MSSLLYTVLALIPVFIWILYSRLSQWRYKRFAHIPSTLASNIFFGHLGHIASEYKRVGSSSIHPDYVFENIWHQQGRPDFLFFDTRPVQSPLVLVTSHALAEQVSKSSKTQQYSVAKSPTLQGNFGALIGPYSLISENGESWRELRKAFNPGFAPQHLISLLPVIVNKTCTLISKLDILAESGVATELDPHCTDVTFDIIGEVVTGIDFKAQGDWRQAHPVVNHFRTLQATYVGGNGGLMPSWLNVLARARKYIYSRRLDAAVKTCIQERFRAIKTSRETHSKDTKDRSVLALALKDTQELTPYVLQSTADQVKSFMFAGHDTTAILLQRLLYTLSIYPDCLARIRTELDSIFGDSDPQDVLLSRPEETLKALKYTSACIKEALRLWPPAATARMPHNGFNVRTSDGDDVCLDETVIYLCHYIIQRDPKVYGETADDFVPERWVEDFDTSSSAADEDATAAGASKVPASAWRAFERGPRSCIGQELANIEARVILACIIRRYDFVKVGLGEVETDHAGKPILGEKGSYKTKSELVNTMSITSRPIDRTVMRIQLRESVK